MLEILYFVWVVAAVARDTVFCVIGAAVVRDTIFCVIGAAVARDTVFCVIGAVAALDNLFCVEVPHLHCAGAVCLLFIQKVSGAF